MDKIPLTKISPFWKTKTSIKDPLSFFEEIDRKGEFCTYKGIHSFIYLGNPYLVKQVLDKTKKDWTNILENVTNKKWRLDMLKFGLHARFNHLFRCIEPRITSQIAPELDNWFFEQVCIVAGEHWDKRDEGLAAHYFQPMCFGGSGI